MGFSNPVVGGTTLVRPAIHSPDYVPGVSGWSINIDGSVEFNNGTFRGTITAAQIIGAIITGGVIQTSATNPRIVIDSTTNTITFINNAGHIDLNFSINPGTIRSNSQVAPSGDIQLTGGILQWVGTNNNGNYQSYTDVTDNVLKIFNVLNGGVGIANGTLVRLDASGVAETWHIPGTTPGVNYSTGWAASTTFNGSTGWAPLKYEATPDNHLEIGGCFTVAAGATTTILNVPVQYRPTALAGQNPIPCQSNLAGALTYFNVALSTSGNLIVIGQTGGSIAAGREYLMPPTTIPLQ